MSALPPLPGGLPLRGTLEPWSEYKARRQAAWDELLGLRTTPCVACAGSGRYDSGGSPRCGGCAGTGLEWVPGPKRADFRGRHALSESGRCKNCGERTRDLYGCPGRRVK